MVYWTLDYFKILYNEYTVSGVNVREFCRVRGIKENRFYYWIKMLKSQALSALDTPREFIPISPGAANRLKTLSLCLVLQPQIGFIYTLTLLICAESQTSKKMDSRKEKHSFKIKIIT